ncbi:hypothetical protein FQN57_003039, partial [Myotisia sp. PD_48]
MYRMTKPKLTLSIASATATTSHSLKSPAALSIPRTPLSPLSPAGINATRINQFSTAQQPSYTYANSSNSKSILKKSQSSRGAGKTIRFSNEPVVHCVTPIENPHEYYGSYTKMSKDERRWSRDDTSVAILETRASANQQNTIIHFHKGIAAKSEAYRGIHPVVALHSHESTLAGLVNEALKSLPPPSRHGQHPTGEAASLEQPIHIEPSLTSASTKHALARRKPDFISVTRGPGMRTNLAVGLAFAKGLAVAWQIPIVGVHHMLAHLLTPRLASTLELDKDRIASDGSEDRINALGELTPDFPFLSLLVSGGHTFLVYSNSLTDHKTMGSTIDIPLGTVLDKFARMSLPQSYIENATTTMYGKLLEQFAFPNGLGDYADYQPPATRGQEAHPVENTQWGWRLGVPRTQERVISFTFAGLLASAQREVQRLKQGSNKQQKRTREEMQNLNLDFLPHEARVAFARDFMRVCFEHVASQTVLALRKITTRNQASEISKPGDSSAPLQSHDINSLVISGGVAAN